MEQMHLNDFAKNPGFAFFVQYGHHEVEMYIHSHADFSELVIVLEGSATHIVDGERYQIYKGDVFVINNDTAHGYTDAHNFRICNIMFQPSFLRSSTYDLAESAGFQALFILEPQYTKTHHFISRLRLTDIQFLSLLPTLDTLLQEYESHPYGWKTMVMSYFFQLVVKLSRLYETDNTGDTSGILKLAASIAYLEKNYAETVSVSKLAALSHYSEKHFVRLFKETMHCLPTDYLTSLRLQNARELLRTESVSITDIAIRCGFNDGNYFARIFKKQYHMTPREYRKAARL